MLRAIFFDFNGVIADDEPIHLQMFQKVLAEERLQLSSDAYYQSYIGMDDRGCFETVLASNGRKITNKVILELIRKKSEYYTSFVTDNLVFFSGVIPFVKKAASRYPLAVVSGALRSEIEFILNRGGMREAFQLIVSAEDVSRGKPDPESYTHGLSELNRLRKGQEDLFPKECLVIEDTLAGIEAAHGTGMKCLAVANSYTVAELSSRADLVTTTLENLPLERLERLF